MTLDMKAMILVFVYAILSNIILLSIGSSDDSISCGDITKQVYTNDYTTGNYSQSSVSETNGIGIMSLALNRCVGFPSWIYWLTQIPTILGILYIIRAFVGWT